MTIYDTNLFGYFNIEFCERCFEMIFFVLKTFSDNFLIPQKFLGY